MMHNVPANSHMPNFLPTVAKNIHHVIIMRWDKEEDLYICWHNRNEKNHLSMQNNNMSLLKSQVWILYLCECHDLFQVKLRVYLLYNYM